METPLRSKNLNESERCNVHGGVSRSFIAPETPFLKRIGFGTGVGVYQLERSRIGKSPWALKKVLRTHKEYNYGKRISDEASLLKQFNHPNIVGFRGFTKTQDGREVLAMEQCTLSLGDMIEQRREEKSAFFKVDEILTVCLNIANALKYLHNEVMLMHGDIKSYNILINGDFKEIKLCDFGVSIKVDKDGKALGEYVGTRAWSAPEALNETNVTTKADIFSLGLVIYEMITLNPPHFDENDYSCVKTGDFEDDYDDAEDYDIRDNEENYGKRPELPAVGLDETYNLVIDIFNLCTEQDPRKRPLAKDLVDLLEKT